MVQFTSLNFFCTKASLVVAIVVNLLLLFLFSKLLNGQAISNFRLTFKMVLVLVNGLGSDINSRLI